MFLIDHYANKADAVARIGEEVLADARATGTCISYSEAAYGTDVIREWPDGRRVRMRPDGSVDSIPARGRRG